MLRPQDTATRERKRLDGLWRFAPRPGAARAGASAGGSGPLPGAREMPVPASYNDIVADAAVRDHVGDVWYQRTRPRARAAGPASGSCCASTPPRTAPRSWVDDAEVVAHEGGYTPFEADVTDARAAGRRARITVVVNNELTLQSIPPGVVEDDAGRPPRQRYFHDFFNYAGPAPHGLAVRHAARRTSTTSPS